MAGGNKSASSPKKKAAPASRALYLYAISQMPEGVAPRITSEGIDGEAQVEAVRSEGYLCWISRVAKSEFAEHLQERMQNLEWLASAGLRHQRVVAEISTHVTALPARFGTVFLSDESLAQHLKERKKGLEQAFGRVADADEWGVKIFATARRSTRSTIQVASGSEYLKRKAELLQPRSGKLDEEIVEFVEVLTELSVAASAGGKASAGQPGLVWHGSFLVRRKDRPHFDEALKKYAAAWQDSRRIDCSGPWPPYSFVGDHVH